MASAGLIISRIMGRLFWLLAILLILVTLYVSLGRQIIPLVANYRAEVETRISTALGMPVSVGRVRGDWRGLNPALALDQMQILLPQSGQSAASDSPVLIRRLDLELDVLASILQRRLVLETVNVEGMAFEFVELEEGGWQLAGVNQNRAGNLDAARVFDIASRFGNLELQQTRLTFHYLSGEQHMLEQGSLRFQSRGPQHFLHLDAHWANNEEPVLLSAEFQGDQLSSLSGKLHVLLPDDDYSALLQGQGPRWMQARTVRGAAQLWMDIEEGGLKTLQADVLFPELAVLTAQRSTEDLRQDLQEDSKYESQEDSHLLQLQELSGRLALRRNTPQSSWEGVLQNFGFTHMERNWPAGSISVDLTDEGQLWIQADVVDAQIAAGLLLQTDSLPADIAEVISGLDPRGRLSDLLIQVQRTQESIESILVSASLDDLDVAAFRGAPAIWGVQGLAHIEALVPERSFRAGVDVDARDMMLHLPGLFEAPWHYTSVRGSVHAEMDISAGLNARVVSSVIEVKSDIIDGRAQFAIESLRDAEDNHTAGIDLVVGAQRATLARKDAYLPTAPDAPESIQGVMQWLNEAVISGEGAGSGLIYRGSLIPGAAAEERTLQMFYQVADGTLAFDPQWPALTNLQGTVHIDDGRADIRVRTGETLGMYLGETTAHVRPGSQGVGSWLTVRGSARGDAGQGISYLQQTPVTGAVGDLLADWQAEGELELSLQLGIPLGIPAAVPEIEVNVSLRENSLFIPQAKLPVTAIAGELIYRDSELTSNNLRGEIFGNPVQASLQSGAETSSSPGTIATFSGAADLEAFENWQMHTPLTSALAANARGTMEYAATLSIPPGVSGAMSPKFSMVSDLNDVALDFPAPIGKRADTLLPFNLELDFLQSGLQIRSNLQNLLQVDLRVDSLGQVERGLIFLGNRDDSLPIRRYNASAPGVEVLGHIGHIEVDQWTDFFREVADDAKVTADAGFTAVQRFASLADVQIDRLDIFGQTLTDVDLQLATRQDRLDMVVESDFVSGSVSLPRDRQEYIEVSLAHLRLPAAPEAEEAPAESEEEAEEPLPPREDPFAAVDPRDFPKMHFNVAELRRGETDFGSWRFTLEPEAQGARVSNLLGSVRGLQIGSEANKGSFFWYFDGDIHQSHLSAGIQAGNLGNVLSSFGYAPSIESSQATFNSDLSWEGSPGFFSAAGLRGRIDVQVRNGRFLQGGSGTGSSALKLISILNFDAVIRRLRFSDDLIRSGLAYDEISGVLEFNAGVVNIADRLQIIGPSSLFQIRGLIDLRDETIDGSMYITLPVSDNIPWLSGLAALNNLINWQVAIGVFILDRIFGDQMNSLTSAHYLLQGPWEGLEPRLNQVFSAGGAGSVDIQSQPAQALP